MRDHITPAMHRQFMSMSERDIASASTRNTTPEHPDPQSLNPSNLLDSPPQQPPPPPSHTYSLPPSVTKEFYSTLCSPDPQTPPCLGLQRPSPSPPLSRLLTLSRHQQWLYCTPEEADIWKPKRNELETLNKKPKKHVRFASPHDANADADGEEDLDSKQKKCQQIKQQPPQLPSPPPNSPSPTKPIPHHDIESGHSAPAHKASENMECKPAKNEMRFDEEEEDEEEEDMRTVLGNGDEGKGEALYECGGRANGGGGGREIERGVGN